MSGIISEYQSVRKSTRDIDYMSRMQGDIVDIKCELKTLSTNVAANTEGLNGVLHRTSDMENAQKGLLVRMTLSEDRAAVGIYNEGMRKNIRLVVILIVVLTAASIVYNLNNAHES